MSKATLNANKGLAQEYSRLLSPSGHFVAVKLLRSLEEVEPMPRPERKLALCQLICEVRYYGNRPRITIAEDLDPCYAAPRMLGFTELPPEAWKRYVG